MTDKSPSNRSVLIISVTIVILMVIISSIFLTSEQTKQTGQSDSVSDSDSVSERKKKIFIAKELDWMKNDDKQILDFINTTYARTGIRKKNRIHITLLYIDDILGVESDEIEKKIRSKTFNYSHGTSGTWTLKKWLNDSDKEITVMELNGSDHMATEIEENIKKQIIELMKPQYALISKRTKKIDKQKYDVEIYHFRRDSQELYIHFKKYKNPKLHITTSDYFSALNAILDKQVSFPNINLDHIKSL